MKKIMSDKSFWIILVASLVSLIVLTIGVVLLTGRNSKEFYSAGYIINSTATKSDRYYFSENTVYKENVFEEYVFTDVDNNEVSTSKDNFIHYLDNSLSFMKNGVILDLDNFNENIVPYYNITDESIVQYNNGGYYIETADKTLVFGNFLGRITDNKYIVVGNNVRVKLAGNDNTVKGDYFEILFVEDGVVKVENQEGSYQTVADGTIIYVGDNIMINLGDKNVSIGDEVKLSLSELTIDGNENIDIVPDGLVNNGSGGGSGSGDGEGDGTGDGTGTGSGTGTGDGNGTGSGNGDGTGTGEGDGTGTGDGTGEGTGSGEGDGETTTILRKEVSVTLTQASTDVNSISAKFQVIDTMEAIKGNLVLTVVNTDTGRTVYTKLLANTPEEQLVVINTLTSDCNYVMTVVDENNETSTQYFQKSFRTDSLNLRLKRELVTESSLAYSLDFGDNSDVVSAQVTLKDTDGNEIYRHTIENGSDTFVSFEGLTNNTLYNVTVDNVVIGNVLYDSLYSSTTSDLTLKVKPTLGNISVKTNDEVKTFTLSMDGVTDEDSAIVKYTYQIFAAEDLNEENLPTAEPVYSFSRSELENQILTLDEAKGLYGNKDYAFKIVAQYYDNYRYNEVSTMMSDYFQILGKPTISFEATEIGISSIAGTITIEDADCTIPYSGRACFDRDNEFIIRYYGGTSSNRNVVENAKFNPDTMTIDFEVDGLTENTLYSFEVYADVDFDNGEGLQTSQYIGGFNASTKGIVALMMQNWTTNAYSYDNPISLTTEMVSTSPEDTSIDSLASITFNLYSGDVSKTIEYATPIASLTVTGNVKDMYYNKSFDINSSMFEYKYVDSETGETVTTNVANLSVLKELSGGRLSKNYTVEITDAKDESGYNEFPIINGVYVYQTPSILLLEDQVATPEIIVEEITNIQTKAPSIDEVGIYEEEYGIKYNSLLSDEIVRGYKVIVKFDAAKIEQFVGGDSIIKVNYYVHDSYGNLIENRVIDFSELSDEFLNQEYITYFFIGDGTDYKTVDKDLRRGNTYTFSFDLNIDDDSDIATPDLVFPASRPTSNAVTPIKQAPTFRLYINNSTANSVTYRYQVSDPDNALYLEDGKYYIYYSVSGNEEQFTTEFVKDGSADMFTLDNLSNGSIYSIQYFSAVSKTSRASKITIGNYYFDGYYDATDYNINYDLVYGNYDNRLKIVFEDTEFLNRISAYLVTLEADGQTYQQIVSDLEMYDEERKCIIVDYANLVTDTINLKNKDITVTVDAFYDTGYAGFGQASLLGSYLTNLNLVSEEDGSKVGYVYQSVGTNEAGKYFYNTATEFKTGFDYPRGILGFELISSEKMSSTWKFNTSNLIDILNNKLVKYGYDSENIGISNLDIMAKIGTGSITLLKDDITFVPKVLDVVTASSDDETFKFTSIIPKVSATNTSLINGSELSFNLSIDSSTIESDYIKTDGKYKFYIDIYEEQNICTEIEVPVEPSEGEEDTGETTTEEVCTVEKVFVKTVETDYDTLSTGVVVIDGLKPNSLYYYKISADMNKNGEKVKTPLFKTGSGYVEFEASFSTLGVKGVFNKVNYSYDSTVTVDTYSNRLLTVKAFLNNTEKFDLRYEIYDANDAENPIFETIIQNEDIDVTKKIASYVYDITGDDYVFGPNYYTLVITAVTDDENAYELELLNEKLIDDAINGKNYTELKQATFNISQNAGIDDDYSYYIDADINVKDEYKVINDDGTKGKFYIELQDSSYNSVCRDGSTNCAIEVQLRTGTAGDMHECNVGNSMATSCEVSNLGSSGDQFKVSLRFDDLKSDTAYVTYVHTDVYMNNVSLTEDKKVSEVYARKTQYTKSALNFSLGSVTPSVASKSSVKVTFVGGSNIKDSLVGIDYHINVEGLYKVAAGSLGVTSSGDSGNSFIWGQDTDGFYYITINFDVVSGRELGLNNYIILTYYYKDSDGNVVALKLGEDTTYRYDFKLES